MTKITNSPVFSKVLYTLLAIFSVLILGMYLYMAVVWTPESLRVSNIRSEGNSVTATAIKKVSAPYLEPRLLRTGIGNDWFSFNYSVDGKDYTVTTYDPNAKIGKDSELFYSAAHPSEAVTDISVFNARTDSIISISVFVLYSAVLTFVAIKLKRVKGIPRDKVNAIWDKLKK